jgi:hypothetical protein
MNRPMNRSKYRISLRIRHPSVDPGFISLKLGLKAISAWKAGERRVAPNGNEVGIAEHSFCNLSLDTVPDLYLADALKVHVQQLSAHSEFLRELVATQGRIEFYVGWFVDRHVGDIFDAGLLQSLGTLGIDLVLEVYGPDEKSFDPVVLDFKQTP